MNNLRLHGVWLLLVLFVVACGGTPQPNPRFTPYPEEAEILGLANNFRAQARTCGTQAFPAAPAMTWVEAIGDAAWFHSTDMGAANTANHVGATTEERLRARGFDAGPVAENRARTNLPATASDAFNIWVANPTACANIMNPTFTVMGAGMWGQYEGGNATNLAFWTQILAAPRGAAPAPTLAVSPTTTTTTVGGAAVAFSATLTNSTEAINWTLTGPGSLSSSTGATTNYTPPATGAAGTATLTAKAGTLTASATITINAAAPTPTLTLSPSTATATVGGGNVTIKATLTNSNAAIAWSMTGPGVFGSAGAFFVYVPPTSGNGGTVTVTATAGTLTANATITVTPAAPAPSLSVSPTTTTVSVGGAAIPFSATLNNSNATINWSLTGAGSLSGTTGANVNYTPPATGAAGTATLTASAAGLTASATITINAAAPAITVTPTTAFTTVGGANVIITASSNQITWNMTGPGTFSWVGETFTYIPPATGTGGTAVVTASLLSGAGTASATITVGPPPSLTVSPTTATVTEGGAAIPFSATLVSSNATINWSLTGPGSLSSTTGANINYTPPATGGPTTATLTATAGALTASATITIQSSAPSLSVSPSTATTQVGGVPTTITATLLNSAATINWSLTGPGSLSATTGTSVSYKPPATGTGGTATVTASAGALTASATFTINPPPNPDINPFLTLINQFRSQPQTCQRKLQNGQIVTDNMPAVPPVSFNTLLNTAARLHSEDMATNNYFDHTGLNGSTFVTRIQATGYTGSPQGENIAAGSSDVQGAFSSWRNSDGGHCQAMMSANANEIGLGYGFNANSQWTHYWTLVFGKSN